MKINNFLACITCDHSEHDLQTLLGFLEYKKSMNQQLICITTSGRASYKKIDELLRLFREKNIPAKQYYLASRSEPDIPGTYMRLEQACGFEHYDQGILLISDIPIEQLLLPIQTSFKFIDDDMIDGRNNTDLLVEFVFAIRSNPNFVLYDARATQIIPS